VIKELLKEQNDSLSITADVETSVDSRPQIHCSAFYMAAVSICNLMRVAIGEKDENIARTRC
jgi:hypothetical protein